MSGNEIVRMPILPFNMVNAHLIRSDAGCVTVYFLSPALKAYFRTVGLYPLTVLHVWRIPAALVFFWYGAHGALPPVFWILAGSGDFLSGVLALPLLRGPVARRTYLSKHLFDFSDFVVAVGTGLTLTLLHDPHGADPRLAARPHSAVRRRHIGRFAHHCLPPVMDRARHVSSRQSGSRPTCAGNRPNTPLHRRPGKNRMIDQASILEQYGVSDFAARVEAVLREARFADCPIPWQDLAPLDQFHVGGAVATAALASRLGIQLGALMLDVGCGLGGPSRHLASVYGCTVRGIDLNPSPIDLATMLTRRAGLADKVTHMRGDAAKLPLEPESFDLAWTQHVAMNIADRRAFYASVHPVLRRGGLFAMFDVVAGTNGPLHFPVPWARDPAASFLLTPDACVSCARSAFTSHSARRS